MTSEDKIYVNASQPATLIDGDKSIEWPTLGEAVVALDHPRAATERSNDQDRRSGLQRFGD
jgi:hypothetical protein